MKLSANTYERMTSNDDTDEKKMDPASRSPAPCGGVSVGSDISLESRKEKRGEVYEAVVRIDGAIYGGAGDRLDA